MSNKGNVSERSLANLKPFTKGDPRASSAGKKGAAVTADIKRRRKMMSEIAMDILNMPRCGRDLDVIETLEDIKFDGDGNILSNLTLQEIALFAIARKAMEGDIKAMIFLRDTSGQKPTERVALHSDADMEEAIADIDAIMASLPPCTLGGRTESIAQDDSLAHQ